MNDSWPARRGFGLADVIAQPHRLDPAGRGEHVVGGQFRAVVEHDASPVRPATAIRLTPARKRSSPPRSLNFGPGSSGSAARRRTGAPALPENAAEHDAELPEVHVVLPRTAVAHQRAEQHFDQQRVADDRRDRLAGGAAGGGQIEIVVVADLGDQPLEIVVLGGEVLLRPANESSSKSFVKSSDTPGKATREPTCGTRANSSHPNRNCRSSRASGPFLAPLGVKLVTACRPTS